MNFSDTTVSEVEEVLGMSVDVFDEAVEVESDERAGDVVNQMDWLSSDEKMVLRYSGEVSPTDLAYLAVKGQMKRFDFTDFGRMFPAEDRFSKQLYTEFVANLARFEVNNYFAENDEEKISANSFLSAGARHDLLSARDNYMSQRTEAMKYGLPSNAILEAVQSAGFNETQLWLEYDVAKHELVDEEVAKDFRSAIKDYVSARLNCAAPLAAKKYHHIEEDYEVSDFIVPDEQLLHDTIDYMHSIESDLEAKRQLNKTRNT